MFLLRSEWAVSVSKQRSTVQEKEERERERKKRKETLSVKTSGQTLLFLIWIISANFCFQQDTIRLVLGFDKYSWFILVGGEKKERNGPWLENRKVRSRRVHWERGIYHLRPFSSSLCQLKTRRLTSMIWPVQKPVPRSNQSLSLNSYTFTLLRSLGGGISSAILWYERRPLTRDRAERGEKRWREGRRPRSLPEQTLCAESVDRGGEGIRDSLDREGKK